MPVITTIGVDGMTCGHCVSAVTKELEVVDGVHRISVELRTGETSEVTVLSHEPLDEAAVRAAVTEAGYEPTTVETEENGLAEQAAEQHEQREAHARNAGDAQAG
jgi:copper chaperone